MKQLLFSLFFTLTLFFIGCGDVSQPSNKTNSNTAPNVNNSNTQTEQSSSNQLPVGKSLENGAAQTFKNVSFTIPKDWRKIPAAEPDFAVKFVSTEVNNSITLNVGVSESVAENKGLPQAKTIEEYMTQLNPGQKSHFLEINGTKGILLSSGELTTWLTFPPRDSNGKTVMTVFSISYPKDKFEQSKQLIADILYSVKIKN